MQDTQYVIYSDKSFFQDVCIPMMQHISEHDEDRIVSIPADLGIGYFRRIRPCRNVEMHISDITFYKRTILSRREKREPYTVSFCFSDKLEWICKGSTKRRQMEKGDCCIYRGGMFEMDQYYEAGKRSMRVDLLLDPERFGALIEQLSAKKAACAPELDAEFFETFRTPKTAEAVLNQILRCSFNGDLRTLYLEGKILELAALLTFEVTHADGGEDDRDLSISDLASLMRIRRYIDDNLAAPLTISSLAQQSFMSQSKLRSVFREQFGITIHQYILNKRMEQAKKLFQAGSCRVKDVAAEVGYSNISHFSDTFKRRFGCTPSEYCKTQTH